MVRRNPVPAYCNRATSRYERPQTRVPGYRKTMDQEPRTIARFDSVVFNSGRILLSQ
jgi:hypothetical protein